MESTYLIDVIVLLAAAVVTVPLAGLSGLGTVPGFLLAGVILGPSGLALIKTTGEIAHLAEFGVVLLLFVIGVELKPARLWEMCKQVFGLGALQVFVSGLVITAIMPSLTLVSSAGKTEINNSGNLLISAPRQILLSSLAV